MKNGTDSDFQAQTILVPLTLSEVEGIIGDVTGKLISAMPVASFTGPQAVLLAWRAFSRHYVAAKQVQTAQAIDGPDARGFRRGAEERTRVTLDQNAALLSQLLDLMPTETRRRLEGTTAIHRRHCGTVH